MDCVFRLQRRRGGHKSERAWPWFSHHCLRVKVLSMRNSDLQFECCCRGKRHQDGILGWKRAQVGRPFAVALEGDLVQEVAGEEDASGSCGGLGGLQSGLKGGARTRAFCAE